MHVYAKRAAARYFHPMFSARKLPITVACRARSIGRIRLLLGIVFLVYFPAQHAMNILQQFTPTKRTLVTYAYSDAGNGGIIDTYNLNYFIIVALSGATPGTLDPLGKVDYNIVVNGNSCVPCNTTLPKVLKLERLRHRRPGWVTVLWRHNVGMDLAAYGHSIKWMRKNRPKEYAYFVFINSSSRGPFMPKWTPPQLHFTDVLTQSFAVRRTTKVVGSYLTCLPEALEPLPGPIIETTFFALDKESLQWILEGDIFKARNAKHESALFGEYTMLRIILSRGGQAESLSMRYALGIDWNDRRHHKCNGNRHASRRGLLEGNISANLLEHVFVKVTWCVRAAEAAVLSSWLVRLSKGEFGTEDQTDENGWAYGSSPEGTSLKQGQMRPDVPNDGCVHGVLKDLVVHNYE